ncbi:hypothetical protein NM208_g75 [Fusarium decemcellulare]|uniref:Uncharacterized protein n=2 Tax=Fusarium decemcellulare TaxID=57161 RepID=A0ACC1T108_9HYPO|nr:hypothetical protein NM208_g633 [Fusarium decemcellulare]KAJ3550255.1 hypothetical protein NM208_g75 [Fusarium decemcellulare]
MGGGCWTCRRRHTKCDETKPSCLNCRIRGIECDGYGIRLAEFTARGAFKGQLVSKVTRGSRADGSPEEDRPRKRSKPQTQTVDKDNAKDSLHVPGDRDSPATTPAHPALNDAGIEAPFSVQSHEEPLNPDPTHISAQTSSSAENTPTSCHSHGISLDELFPAPDLLSIESPDQNTASNADQEADHSNADDLWNEPPDQSLLDIGPLTFLEAQSLDLNFEGNLYPAALDFGQPNELASDYVDLDIVGPSQSQTDSNLDRVDQQWSQRSPLVGKVTKTITLPPSPDDPFDQYLFFHYIDNLSLRLYPVKPDQNPYREVYGNLAARCPPLHHTILFASALHLANLGRLPKFAIQQYRKTMRQSFRDALVKQDELEGLGATVLLSVVFDVIGTGLDTWSSKLIGCRRLLQTALSRANLPISSDLQCMIVQYNWAAIMSRTLLRDVQSPDTLIELRCIDEVFDPQQTPRSIQGAHHQSHWWNNLPDHQMHLFLRHATDLAADVDRHRAGPDAVDRILQLMPEVSELVQSIRNWEPDISLVDQEYVASVEHFNNIWRQGMICYVYHEIYSLPSDDSRIQTCVENSIESFRRLSWLQACLFPVFMLAVHAQTQEARSCFETGLTSMHTSLAFQAPVSVVLTLKNIWEYSDENGARETKWRDLVKDLSLELNILL